jgi:hypothetical protein
MIRTCSLALLMLSLLELAAPIAPAGEPPFCELYAVGHFGNWYEVAGQNEMRQVFTEEKLQREVYGAGPLRHILNRRFVEMPWYKSWASQPPPPAPQAEQ